jgi:hypothetical protein
VVVESANLESTVDMALRLITGLKEDQFKALIADLNMAKKLDLVKEFGPARLTSKKRKTALTKLLGDLNAMTKERNTAVHGNWSPEGGWTIASLADLNAVGPLQATSHRSKIILKAEKLDELADRYLSTNKALWKMLMDFWVKPAANRSLRAHAQRIERETERR